MNIRELVIKICTENGMEPGEIDAFLAHADAAGQSGSMDECKQRTVEELGEKQGQMFMDAMKMIVPLQVDEFRKQSGHQSLSA